MEETERQISKIVKADIHEQFPYGFIFDPIRVYPRTGHMSDDYLKVFIIYDGKMEDLNPALTYGIMTRIKPKVRALGIKDDLSDGFVEKADTQQERLVEFFDTFLPSCQPQLPGAG